MKKPLVFCLIDGFGLSSLWRGNAVASCNPVNFLDLWSGYNHELLFQPKSKLEPVYDNPESALSTFLSGKIEPSNREILDQDIQSGNLENNSAINENFSLIQKSNSALHLIGSLSNGSGKYGEVKHLLSLLRLAKQKNIFRVYIHLILDSSSGLDFDQAKSLISSLNRQIDILGTGEIASISGFNYAKNWQDNRLSYLNFIKAHKAIVEGKGNIFLGAEQAISQNSSRVSSVDLIPPCVITYKNKPIGTLHDLDSIFFFNHNNEPFTNLILSFLNKQNLSNALYVPKFLNLLTFFETTLPYENAIGVAISKKTSTNLLKLLDENKISSAIVSDSFKSIALQNISHGLEHQEYVPALSLAKYCANPKPYILEIFRKTDMFIDQGLDFILMDIPSVDVIANNGTFDQTVNALHIIDGYINTLAKKILSIGGTLILSSAYGNSEKMIHRNKYEHLNGRTDSPVPFLIISDQTRNAAPAKSIENELMYGIMQRKNYITDVAPTILDLFKLPASDLPGKSLLRVGN